LHGKPLMNETVSTVPARHLQGCHRSKVGSAGQNHQIYLFHPE
jgi:hypothetical protein